MAEVPDSVKRSGGEVVSENQVNSGDVLTGSETAVPGHHNIVFTQVVDSGGRVISPDDNSTFTAATSFVFSLADGGASVRHHIDTASERDTTWARDVTRTMQALEEEMKRYGDVMLLDLQDTYRNLPLKVALCHQRFQQNTVPEYVMKTDDDCFINLPEILRSLQRLPSDAFTWWGNFRDYWAVERQGKWREESYSSSVYPRFACGSGYVLSGPLSSWLAANTHIQRMFQGEDVSMGIWLAGLNIRHLQDARWRCDMTCQDRQLSLPELSPEQVTWYWNISRFCPGMCHPC